MSGGDGGVEVREHGLFTTAAVCRDTVMGHEAPLVAIQSSARCCLPGCRYPVREERRCWALGGRELTCPTC
jgi:hypothetical protein